MRRPVVLLRWPATLAPTQTLSRAAELLSNRPWSPNGPGSAPYPASTSNISARQPTSCCPGLYAGVNRKSSAETRTPLPPTIPRPCLETDYECGFQKFVSEGGRATWRASLTSGDTILTWNPAGMVSVVAFIPIPGNLSRSLDSHENSSTKTPLLQRL